MTYFMFIMAEAIGASVLYFTYRGVFGLATAFLVVLVMLSLSFHVMVRKPDGTSIRMACFAAVLWIATIFAGGLALELRTSTITLGAAAFSLVVGTCAVLASWAIYDRPPNLDLD